MFSGLLEVFLLRSLGVYGLKLFLFVPIKEPSVRSLEGDFALRLEALLTLFLRWGKFLNCSPLPLSVSSTFLIFSVFLFSLFRDIPLKALNVMPESFDEFFVSSKARVFWIEAGDLEVRSLANKFPSFLPELEKLEGDFMPAISWTMDFLPERSLFLSLDSDSSRKEVGLGDLYRTGILVLVLASSRNWRNSMMPFFMGKILSINLLA